MGRQRELARRSWAAAVVGAAALSLCLASGAAAAPDLDPADLTATDVDKPLGLAVSGRAAKCRPGTEIASGGAYAHKEGGGRPNASGTHSIRSSFPDVEGNRRLANASSGGVNEELRVRALCLPERQLNGATTVTQSVTVTPLGTGSLTLPCPGGEQIVTGGAYVHDVGSPFNRSLSYGVVSSSAPTSDALGWYAAAWNNTSLVSIELTVVVVCLPPDRMGEPKVKTKDIPVSGQGQEPSGAVKCGGKQRALAGGAYWHPGSGTPDPALSDNARASGSVSLQKGERWYADGYTISNVTATLRVVAVCLSA